MQKWVEGTVVNQKRWTQTLFTLQVEADVARFEAGQFAKLALAVEGEMVARPYSFVNSPEEHPHEFYYVTLLKKWWSVPGFSCSQSARCRSRPAARPGSPTTTPTPCCASWRRDIWTSTPRSLKT